MARPGSDTELVPSACGVLVVWPLVLLLFLVDGEGAPLKGVKLLLGKDALVLFSRTARNLLLPAF